LPFWQDLGTIWEQLATLRSIGYEASLSAYRRSGRTARARSLALGEQKERLEESLNPDPRSLATQYAILDDRERPYYEHRLAA